MTRISNKTLIPFLFALLTPHISMANTFDPAPSWPLCGRISEEPAAQSKWLPGQNCPAERFGSTQHSDFPISSTFGPRQLVSGNYRYDFHRGIDLPTPEGTPVFAVADGIVKIAGVNKSFDDPLVMIRHSKTGGTKCTASKGCDHSLYLHLQNNTLVKARQKVKKGDLIGYTGASKSGFAHLHFEIRRAITSDSYSYWQRDAIHPLKVLPYPDQEKSNIAVSIDQTTQTGTQLVVSANVNVPINELDMVRIETKVYDRQSGLLVPQPGNTANAKGYHVNPAWFDVEQWNREYTHKNSSKIRWASFAKGKKRACPYAQNHPSRYTAHNHMDQGLASNKSIGSLNGLLIAPEYYNTSSSVYQTRYTFNELVGATGGVGNSCIIVEATDLQGNVTSATYNCSDL